MNPFNTSIRRERRPSWASPLGVWTCVKSPGDSSQAPVLSYAFVLVPFPGPAGRLLHWRLPQTLSVCRGNILSSEFQHNDRRTNEQVADPGRGTTADMMDAEHRKWYFRFALGDYSIKDCLDDEQGVNV